MRHWRLAACVRLGHRASVFLSPFHPFLSCPCHFEDFDLFRRALTRVAVVAVLQWKLRDGGTRMFPYTARVEYKL